MRLRKLFDWRPLDVVTAVDMHHPPVLPMLRHPERRGITIQTRFLKRMCKPASLARQTSLFGNTSYTSYQNRILKQQADLAEFLPGAVAPLHEGANPAGTGHGRRAAHGWPHCTWSSWREDPAQEMPLSQCTKLCTFFPKRLATKRRTGRPADSPCRYDHGTAGWSVSPCFCFC